MTQLPVLAATANKTTTVTKVPAVTTPRTQATTTPTLASVNQLAAQALQLNHKLTKVFHNKATTVTTVVIIRASTKVNTKANIKANLARASKASTKVVLMTRPPPAAQEDMVITTTLLPHQDQVMLTRQPVRLTLLPLVHIHHTNIRNRSS